MNGGNKWRQKNDARGANNEFKKKFATIVINNYCCIRMKNYV